MGLVYTRMPIIRDYTEPIRFKYDLQSSNENRPLNNRQRERKQRLPINLQLAALVDLFYTLAFGRVLCHLVAIKSLSQPHCLRPWVRRYCLARTSPRVVED